MTAGITRYWALRQDAVPGRWTLGYLYDDGAEPLACLRLTAESADEARERAAAWLAAGGESCERWTPAAEGWIAVTTTGPTGRG